MEFCPKCGAVLIQKRKNYGCAIAIVSEKDKQTLPIVAEKCKQCNNEKAFFWTVQTRSGDEAETKFFKCTKCEHTWREYR